MLFLGLGLHALGLERVQAQDGVPGLGQAQIQARQGQGPVLQGPGQAVLVRGQNQAGLGPQGPGFHRRALRGREQAAEGFQGHVLGLEVQAGGLGREVHAAVAGQAAAAFQVQAQAQRALAVAVQAQAREIQADVLGLGGEGAGQGIVLPGDAALAQAQFLEQHGQGMGRALLLFRILGQPVQQLQAAVGLARQGQAQARDLGLGHHQPALAQDIPVEAHPGLVQAQEFGLFRGAQVHVPELDRGVDHHFGCAVGRDVLAQAQVQGERAPGQVQGQGVLQVRVEPGHGKLGQPGAHHVAAPGREGGQVGVGRERPAIHQAAQARGDGQLAVLFPGGGQGRQQVQFRDFVLGLEQLVLEQDPAVDQLHVREHQGEELVRGRALGRGGLGRGPQEVQDRQPPVLAQDHGQGGVGQAQVRERGGQVGDGSGADAQFQDIGREAGLAVGQGDSDPGQAQAQGERVDAQGFQAGGVAQGQTQLVFQQAAEQRRGRQAQERGPGQDRCQDPEGDPPGPFFQQAADKGEEHGHGSLLLGRRQNVAAISRALARAASLAFWRASGPFRVGWTMALWTSVMPMKRSWNSR